LAVSAALALNRTLNNARAKYNSATTVEQFRAARNLFSSARRDPGYNAATDETPIKQGISNCDKKIAELTDGYKKNTTLTVNGSLSQLTINTFGEGEDMDLSIATNQASVYVSSLPSWIKKLSVSKTRVSLRVLPNTSGQRRTAAFRITAKDKYVTVNVIQDPKESSGLVIDKISFTNSNSDAKYAPFYQASLCYLYCNLHYSSDCEQNKTVSVRILNEDNEYLNGSNSPEGYTFKCETSFKETQTGNVQISGWGTENGGSYAPGTYTYQVFIDGKMVAEQTFTVNAGGYAPEPDDSDSSYKKDDTSKDENETFDDLSPAWFDFTNMYVWSRTAGDNYADRNIRDMNGITVKLKYNSTETRTVNLMARIFGPKENLLEDSNSAAGYSMAHDSVVIIKGSGELEFKYFGGMDAPDFRPGMYTFELYLDDDKILSAKVRFK